MASPNRRAVGVKYLLDFDNLVQVRGGEHLTNYHTDCMLK